MGATLSIVVQSFFLNAFFLKQALFKIKKSNTQCLEHKMACVILYVGISCGRAAFF